MNLTDLPAAITATANALTDWTRVDPEPLSSREVHRWSRTDAVTEVIELAAWGSSTNGCVTLSYNRGGAEEAFLVLSEAQQVTTFLRMVGAMPSAREVAEAALTPDVIQTGDPDWYVAQMAQDVLYHRMADGAS